MYLRTLYHLIMPKAEYSVFEFILRGQNQKIWQLSFYSDKECTKQFLYLAFMLFELNICNYCEEFKWPFCVLKWFIYIKILINIETFRDCPFFSFRGTNSQVWICIINFMTFLIFFPRKKKMTKQFKKKWWEIMYHRGPGKTGGCQEEVPLFKTVQTQLSAPTYLGYIFNADY